MTTIKFSYRYHIQTHIHPIYKHYFSLFFSLVTYSSIEAWQINSLIKPRDNKLEGICKYLYTPEKKNKKKGIEHLFNCPQGFVHNLNSWIFLFFIFFVECVNSVRFHALNFDIRYTFSPCQTHNNNRRVNAEAYSFGVQILYTSVCLNRFDPSKL